MLVLHVLSLLLCVGAAFANITGQNPANGACLCINGSGVNVRATACGNVNGQSNTGSCYRYRGTKQTCTLSGVSYEFFSIEFGSGGWVAGNYLVNGQASQCNAPTGCPRIFSRAEWGARNPTSISYITQPVPRFFVHHSAGNTCTTQAACMAEVRAIQNLHMNSNGWADVGYNFLVGEDGNAYEGRGWDRVGSHASNWNSQAIGVCVMGTYTNRNPNQAALNAVQQLISCGVNARKLSATYSLHGHRDGVCTECPGTTLYNTIRTWPRFGGRLSGGCAMDDDSV